MREAPGLMTARWLSGEYIGEAKPIARVTIQKPNIRLVRTPENLFSTLVFGGGSVPKELPNVKSVSWNRDIDADVADCTIEFYNTEPLPLGQAPTDQQELDQPGFYTYNRGRTSYSSRWNHQANEWADMLMPDNVIRTFEGYGFTYYEPPEKDPLLMPTGYWMIDEVVLGSDGIITVTCRDIGRMLLDQICFPPVNPFEAGFVNEDHPEGAYSYPVSFTGVNSEPVVNNVPAAPSRLSVSYRTSSNAPYYGDGAVYGHRPRDAFDGDPSSYWLSVGNARPDQGYSFEWIEGGIKKERVRKVRFQSRYAGHTAYLSLYVAGQGWIGSNTVPYNPNHAASAPNGANIPYYRAMAVSGTGWTEFTLGEGVGNVTRVRICFGGLRNSGLGQFPFRAGMRRMEVHGGATTKENVRHFADRNYEDYTNIVKLLCAWGGFYWPRAIRHAVGSAPRDDEWMTSKEKVQEIVELIRANRDLPPEPSSDEVWANRIWPPNATWNIGDARTAIDMRALEVHGLNRGAEVILSDGSKQYHSFDRDNTPATSPHHRGTGDDPAMAIKVGRVWGDFQMSGTTGPAPIPPSVFDKKPLMDGIAYVRDILGYIFMLDELGGVVFKAPNIYSVGNTWRSIGPMAGQRTQQMVTLDERTVVTQVNATISGRNLRERTFVATTIGDVGHMAKGWNPNPIGLRRVGGWTDQHFETAQECRIMAELIALRQLFTYRTDRVTIPGYPAIQVDDQVRIFERVTNEGYIHYVKGISSSLDHETGEYIYELDTHWLGERPFKRWAFDPRQLSKETQEYLKGLYGA